VSSRNVETVRWGYELWSEGELETVMTRFSDDFEYVSSGVVPGLQPVYRGHEGWREFWRDFRETFDAMRIDPREIRDLGSHVIARLRFTAQAQEGLEVTREFTNVWTFTDDGLVRRIEAFDEWSEGLDAVERTA
jgi:ketosteroid isomerase-like protein